jgi:aspartate/methionine/tyrosine aminotransferase
LIVNRNLALLDGFLAEFPHLFEWQRPDGGCIGFVTYKGPEKAEEFTTRLLEETGVLFLPASIFQSELSEVPKDCFRVGFGRAHFPEGLAVARDWLKRNGR